MQAGSLQLTSFCCIVKTANIIALISYSKPILNQIILLAAGGEEGRERGKGVWWITSTL